MKSSESIFESSFSYKLIYIFRINDKEHEGKLKIGEATVHTYDNKDNLTPNCEELVISAKNRIDSYTSTAGIKYELLHVELAVTNKNKSFRDKDVHEVLKRSGYERFYFDTERKQNEWFIVSLDVAINAIHAVKENRKYLDINEMKYTQDPIILRPEQEYAVKKTIAQFKKSDNMLWNAKMRFGKTISTLEIVRREKFNKTIILTHRPVVDDGWYEDFGKVFINDEYKYGSKRKGETLENLLKYETPFIYFASIQDLRGSKEVGGSFEKNELVFSTNWDFVVIDEAHEGTKTEKGVTTLEGVIKLDNNYPTKILKLSGTAFNLLEDYDEDEIYTWDYIMEQEAKKNWYINNFGDTNPYEDLPELQIYTYDLNKLMPEYEAVYDKAFNFREFFKVWTGDIQKDGKELLEDSNIGRFVHEDDVKKFLDLICKSDEKSNYPYSKELYREYFRHSLWMVPGVKEAKALSNLLHKHSVFGSGQFNIINIAGYDEDMEYRDALEAVNKGIGDKPEETYSITISCGKLTTGVTVKPWTAVFMLSGSNSTSASTYLQTIFRVQSPANIGGKMKEKCYVFDFAPDRSLKMIASATRLSIKAGNTSSRVMLGKFLNFCPVISIDGSKMLPYDVDNMMSQLKKAYAERVVNNGFDDKYIYNDNLFKLDENALQKFKDLEEIVGASKPTKKIEKIDINTQGFNQEEYEELQKIQSKPKRELTDEEKQKLEELKEKKKQANTAISILRSISIRIPLLIYGANIKDDEYVTVDNLTKIVDDVSWEEFMPKGVTKELFKDFAQYYEQDIFVEAGRKIRRTAKYADTLSPTERVKEIANIFASFRNPDKETVLTPWKTVNMHMGDTIGGYNFFDKKNENGEYTIVTLEEPRFISHGDVTQNILNNTNVKILEVNSKSGLYPLYITYSLYRQKCLDTDTKKLTDELEQALWNEVIRDNIFVLCKTPMAKTITEKTLIGYEKIKNNIIYDSSLIIEIENDIFSYSKKLNSAKYWGKDEEMRFDAIVGNPPYQNTTGGGQAQATPLYNKFVDLSIKMNPKYISMIMPSRWFSGGFSILDDFRKSFIKDNHIVNIHDFPNALDCFDNVQIKGGVCYFLYDKGYCGECIFSTHMGENIISSKKRFLLEKECDTIIRNNEAISILNKVKLKSEKSFSSIIGKLWPFINVSNFNSFNHIKHKDDDVFAYVLKDKGWISREEIVKNEKLLNKWKLFIPRSIGSGDPNVDIVKPIIGQPNTCCSGTYIVCGPFDNEEQCKSVISYINTKFFHFLLSLKKISQDTTVKCYDFIPLQDFNNVEYSDDVLYKKYKLSNEEIALIEKTVRSDIGIKK